jgi:hypothetical protein
MAAVLMMGHAAREQATRASRQRSDKADKEAKRIAALTEEERAEIARENAERIDNAKQMESTRLRIGNSLQTLFSTEDADGFKSTVKVYPRGQNLDAYAAVQQKIPGTVSGYADKALLRVATYEQSDSLQKRFDQTQTDTSSDHPKLMTRVAKTIKEGWLPIYRSSSKLTGWKIDIIHTNPHIDQNRVEYIAELLGTKTTYSDRKITIVSNTKTDSIIFQTLIKHEPLEFTLENIPDLIKHITKSFERRLMSWNAEYDTQYMRMEAIDFS